jgi:hypothetical protein
MDSQVTFYITTEKYGRLNWSWKPGMDSYPNTVKVRIRVRADDLIEISDWGRANIKDVAEFHDGLWNLRLRDARHKLRKLNR